MIALRWKEGPGEAGGGGDPPGGQSGGVLAVGAGPVLLSLAESLFDTGLSKLHLLVTDAAPTDRQRLEQLLESARRTDPGAEAELELVQLADKEDARNMWRESVRPFRHVLYVSQTGDAEELRALHAVCREERKMLLPAVCIGRTGVAGPLVHPDSGVCWESAWRRIRCPVPDEGEDAQPCSEVAGAMLANAIVHELWNTAMAEGETPATNRLFMLDLDTLEGDWHAFAPHPLVARCPPAELVRDPLYRPEGGAVAAEPERLLRYFASLTSERTGIFHAWEEGDLLQLPLSQCRVQAADPLADGPAGLLPEMVCAAFTHLEARREAGLAGIEAYVSRLAGRLAATLPGCGELLQADGASQEPAIAIGAGETFAEAVCRGLQTCLTERLKNGCPSHGMPSIRAARLGSIDDERCRYYWEALTALRGTPAACLGEDVCGFPAVWIGTEGEWHCGVDANVTLALRRALLHALRQAQNRAFDRAGGGSGLPLLRPEQHEPIRVPIPSVEQTTHTETLRSAISILERNGKSLFVWAWPADPAFVGAPVQVVATLLGEVVPQ
ncbi:hypothetical protein [Gordoniibacillus kamchatkensis]|uniref:hypothetical protein n=1 Tax=Gordoniibacillus kamchatkensis TaxID=1590651 RepID=UPI000698D9CC|nr:hypothetical protein [Paenibacillus sp. VKM B-2647]